MKKILCLLASLMVFSGCGVFAAQGSPELKKEVVSMSSYYFPSEDAPHEGTWLTWPHHNTYGVEYREEIEDIWVQMTAALHTGERVHIVAYSEAERQRITSLLEKSEINLEKIDFVIAKSDDVWSRDTGPMFVYDDQGKLTIADFGFDGWGKKTPYKNDDKIPQAVAAAKELPVTAIPDFVLEGGAVELDGAGTLMAAKSSVVSKNRNSGLTVAQAEAYLKKYLDVSNFIWLDGVTDEDITDAHIDGMARFYDEETLLTVSEEDFFNLYEGIKVEDYIALLNAKNAKGKPYEILEFPMTKHNVSGLEYQGSYLNFYVANKVVLVPVYGDENDALAVKLIAELYEDRKIVPIDVTSLYQYGGMLHCVTQQQPLPDDPAT